MSDAGNAQGAAAIDVAHARPAHQAIGRETAAPDSVAGASSLLRDGAADATTVLFAGAGTKAGWGGTPDDVDLELSTARLQQLISHEPGDMTAAVQAGMPLSQLQTALAEHGQWLALDPATERSGATVGGLLATGDAGPRRLRYGTMRDLAIGATLVLADGTVINSGSHVIKNVAGYDLTKLFYTSLGSLGLIAEVIVRLHPLPPASGTVVAAATVNQANTAARAVASSGVEPSALEWLGPTGTDPEGTLLVRVDGSDAGVDAGATRLASVLTAQGLTPERVNGSGADEQWGFLADAQHGPTDSSTVRAGTLPTRLPQVCEGLTRLGDQHGVTARLVSSAALGLHTVVLSGEAPAQAAVITAWRTQVEGLGGTVAVRERPAEVEAAIDVVGKPPSAIAVLRAVKSQLDPDNRCAPGRFRGWY